MMTIEQEVEHWKQRALAAEAQLGINLPFAQKDLSNKQARVFRHLERFVNERSYPPSVRELANSLGLASTSTVHRYLEVLEEKGYIERVGSSGTTRNIKLLVRSE